MTTVNKNLKFDETLLDILCCPKCQADLEYNSKKSVLICVKCNAEFIVKDNIAILLEMN